jgi:virginiamycin B lyase
LDRRKIIANRLLLRQKWNLIDTRRAMTRTNLLARTLLGTALLGTACIGLVMAQTPSHSAPSATSHAEGALTGKVTSQAEGAIEGVLVGAKKMDSTMATWVVSNAQGQYSFPRDRMEPGKYAIKIRAVGYELPSTSVDVTAQPTKLDLQLNKVTSTSKLAVQLSNGEWLMSAPGTQEEKIVFASSCVTCHTLQRELFSRYSADEMAQVVQRMATHTNNSSPMHPWVRPSEGPAGPPTARQMALAKYISSINLSSTDTFEFPLKTNQRPKGKATEVMYTTYDLPRPDAAPHDTTIDAQGNIWYSDFDSQFIGKLDPKTGKVVEYPVPLGRTGPLAQGGLQIAIDREGLIYYGNMSQMQIVRLDPKTAKMEFFKVPVADSDIGAAHLTMIDPWFQNVDGKIWTNIAGANGEGGEGGAAAGKAGGTWHVDLASNTWTRVTHPHGSPPAGAYDVVGDSQNNMYGMGFGNPRIWMTNGKTLQTVWYDMPDKNTGCRRGHVDSQDRLWCGGFNANDVVMFDPMAAQKFKTWEAHTPWTRPYDAEFDNKKYAWGAGMDTDIAMRVNVETGEVTEYLLPHETNVRHVDVQKSGALSSLWLGDQHGGTIVHIEPLVP